MGNIGAARGCRDVRCIAIAPYPSLESSGDSRGREGESCADDDPRNREAGSRVQTQCQWTPTSTTKTGRCGPRLSGVQTREEEAVKSRNGVGGAKEKVGAVVEDEGEFGDGSGVELPRDTCAHCARNPVSLRPQLAKRRFKQPRKRERWMRA